ncbi:MAG: hypothetical protein AAFR68_01005 [Pseudomonadota bacterium]
MSYERRGRWFGAAATKGLPLFSVQTTRYDDNPAVVTKLAMLLLADANVSLFAPIKGSRHEAAARFMAYVALKSKELS